MENVSMTPRLKQAKKVSKKAASLEAKYPAAHRANEYVKKHRERVAKNKVATQAPEAKVVALPPKVATEAPKAPAPSPKADLPKRNLERFMEATGKTEQEYYEWASEVGRRMHINKLDNLVCAKLGIYTVAHLVNMPTELPEGITLQEVDEFVGENSMNPYELARLWKKVKADAAAWVSKESILNEWLTGIRKEDFEAHGDPNHSGDVDRKWWKKDAVGLDGVLQEINDLGRLNVEITIEDALDFIKAYKPGKYVNPAQRQLQRIEAQFRAVTTFKVKEYYIDHILSMCEVAQPEMADAPF